MAEPRFLMCPGADGDGAQRAAQMDDRQAVPTRALALARIRTHRPGDLLSQMSRDIQVLPTATGMPHTDLPISRFLGRVVLRRR